MTSIPDILFLVSSGIIVLYLAISIAFPRVFIQKKIRNYILLIMIVIPIAVSFVSYRIIGKENADNVLESRSIYKTKLDALNAEIKLDTISIQKVDSILKDLHYEQKRLDSLIKEQERINKRVFNKSINKRISDSINSQLESFLKELSVESSKTIKTFSITQGGKSITYQGKRLVYSETILSDRYTVDSVDVFPILGMIDFAGIKRLMPLNCYIDSMRIRFKVTQNKGKVEHSSEDSVLYVSISPIKETYQYLYYSEEKTLERKPFLDSIVFEVGEIYSIVLDYPNNIESDSIVSFDFLLGRGQINSTTVDFSELYN